MNKINILIILILIRSTLYYVYITYLPTVIECIERSKPNKVLFKEFHSAYFMTDSYHSGKCPVCKADNDNYYGDKYCRQCGQALDWSEDE